MKYLSIGHKVMVYIPEEDKAAHSAVVKYHGQEMKIADRKSVGRNGHAYYHLVGAESEYGIPYAFIKEWLIGL